MSASNQVKSIKLSDKIDGCENFTWSEALYLPTWEIAAFPNSEDVYYNLIETAKKLEDIREILGCAINITSWYRPPLYNQLIKGAPRSYHMRGMAVDFKPEGRSIHKCKFVLADYLDDLDIRMEKHSGNWIHIDLGTPGKSGRYFRP